MYGDIAENRAKLHNAVFALNMALWNLDLLKKCGSFDYDLLNKYFSLDLTFSSFNSVFQSDIVGNKE